MVAVTTGQFIRNLAARFVALVRHREFLLLEALIPQVSGLLAARFVLGKSLIATSPLYGTMMAVMPQWGWGLFAALAATASLAGVVLSAAEMRGEMRVRVVALALHGGLFLMIGLAFVKYDMPIIVCFTLPLFGACIAGAYRVGRTSPSP